MIFVSSSCVPATSIKEAVEKLAACGFRNIELSGGTDFYEGYVEDLLELKGKYGLTYRCHNYFPPPKKNFVLNLASLNDAIHATSMDHVKSALDTSERLGGTRFGFHAGFLIEIDLDELGRPVQKKSIYDRAMAETRFFHSLKSIFNIATSVEVFVENNVLSAKNFANFEGVNPLLMTSSEEILSGMKRQKFKLLLDWAHLKVSARTLGLDFQEELERLLPLAGYHHVSDNNSLEDQNKPLSRQGELYDNMLRFREHLHGKDVTLEVYAGMDEIVLSHEILAEVMNERIP